MLGCRATLRRAPLLGLLLLLGACRGGCGQPDAVRPDATLAALPPEARIVLSIDVARVRASRFWKTLADLVAEDAEDKKLIADLAAATGFDPLRQLKRVVAAFPDDARQRGEFVLLLDGEGMDERRLVAWARDQAKGQGAALVSRSHAGRTLWTAQGSGVSAFFVRGERVVIGGGGWAEKAAALVDAPAAPSAAGHAELASLCRRLGKQRAVWAAAIVPAEVRRALLGADGGADATGAISRLAFGLDLGTSLDAELVLELSNEADARALAARVQTSVAEAKKNAQVLMLGLGPYLEPLTVKAQGASVHFALSLPEAQANDLLSRAAGLARLSRGRAGAAR